MFFKEMISEANVRIILMLDCIIWIAKHDKMCSNINQQEYTLVNSDGK